MTRPYHRELALTKPTRRCDDPQVRKTVEDPDDDSFAMWITVKDPDDHSNASARYNAFSEHVELGDDLFMYADTRVSTHSRHNVIELRVGVHDGRLVADEVSVRRRDDCPPVTSEMLRAIPVARLVRYAAATVQHVVSRGEGGAMMVAPAWPHETEWANVRWGLNDETLRIVARIYRVAYLLGDAPTKTVQTMLDQPRSTVGRWIAAARQRGFLSESRGAGKAGG